ncbi:MAG: efflux RND transporter periplasmic adaptor subunit [bacterium]
MASKAPRILRILLLLLLAVLVTGGGYLSLQALQGTRLGTVIGLKQEAQKKEIYYCPMHPSYKSDKPGDCPICNMSLVKLEPQSGQPAQGDPEPMPGMPGMPGPAGAGSMEAAPPPEALPPGTVQISPQRQQLIGVQIGEVLWKPLNQTLRTVGRLSFDETRVARVQTKIEGWIDRVYADFTGKLVRKGQPLISIYSPELVATQQEFLVSSKARDYLKDSSIEGIASGARSLYDSARQRLKLWDISDQQIEEIRKRGEPIKTLTLYSPMDGFIVARDAFENQRVTPETELYVLADLSRIWVFADIYEYEVPMVKLGQTADVTLSSFPGETFQAKVSYIYPELNPETRTLKVRLELPNPGFRLKPDMYAEVALQVGHGTQLAVPEEAVLDSGVEQIVFVHHEGGYFEPRRVRLGAKVDGQFVVLAGLEAGEKVVTSGNFLIDSESQLKAAMSSMPGGGPHAGHGGAPSSGQEGQAGGARDGREGPQPRSPAAAGGHAGHGG